MSSVTLVESAKLSQNLLIAGVIENVITINRFFQMLPFTEIEGNALAYNRENTLGDAQFSGVGTTITAKAPATFTAVTSSLTTLLGDAEVNGLIQATRSNITDQKATQVASKAKSVGRKYQDSLINGDGTADTFPGLLSLVDSTQTITANAGGGNGDVVSFAYLDQLIDLVTDKDGQVDYLLMNARTIRSYNTLLRALGGASISEVVTLPSGEQVPAYRNIPIFRNDYIPINQTQGTSTACTTVFAGTLDDGSMTHGISGMTALNDAAGLQVDEVGISETKDETITRVKWYCGMALFSLRGLAALKGITN
jgi:hypothetical protein